MCRLFPDSIVCLVIICCECFSWLMIYVFAENKAADQPAVYKLKPGSTVVPQMYVANRGLLGLDGIEAPSIG